MVKVLDQTVPALSLERTLNFEWGVVEPQWILLGLINNKNTKKNVGKKTYFDKSDKKILQR